MPPFFVLVQLLGTSRAEEKFDTAALYHRDTLFYKKPAGEGLLPHDNTGLLGNHPVLSFKITHHANQF